MYILVASFLFFFPYFSQGQIIAHVFPNIAFAPLSVSITSTIPTLSVDSLDLSNYTSVRFVGTVTPIISDLALNFSAYSEGGVRLWVDDFLIIDSGGLHNESSAIRISLQTIPVIANKPLAFRLEYSRWISLTTPPTLVLFWQGQNTSLSVVPSSSFNPNSSVEQTSMAELRDRLISPICPWQTYYRRSAAAHTLTPTGLVLAASLVDVISGSTLDEIFVQRGGSSYISRAGQHSRNGSDYTQFDIWNWNGYSCNISFETTVTNTSQLQFLATTSGVDCNRFFLVIKPLFFDERIGWPENATSNEEGFNVYLPGFPTVSVIPVGSKPIPLNGSLTPAVPYFALNLSSSVVGYCAILNASVPIACPSVDVIIETMAAAKLRASLASLVYGNLSAVYEGIATSILWNTIFAVQEGVISIVSRNPNWAGNNEFVADYVLFEWDSYFIAIQAAIEVGMLRDIGISTLVQVTLARTPRGFVPNWKSGAHSSYDRTENQVGALITLNIVNMLPVETRNWIVSLLVPPLLTWHEWVWTSRMAKGGVYNDEPLMILGSDPSSPHDNGDGNMQGARYESMDNSPAYDSPPVQFNSTTHQIEQYDVSPTALFLSDTEALITLANEIGKSDIVQSLQAHFNATAEALNTRLWQQELGAYANVLFNGTFNARLSPTSFYPMISGVVSDDRVLSLLSLLTSPVGFCINASHTPGLLDFPTRLLTRWSSRITGHSVSCVTVACTENVLLYGRADYQNVEGSVPIYNASLPPPLFSVPLYLYTTIDNITALATNPPDSNFTIIRQEGYCFTIGSIPSSREFKTWQMTNLTLWYLQTKSSYDFRTCGTVVCETTAKSAGYMLKGNGPMCITFDASTPSTLPCTVPLPSIARGDAAFYDQNYWRGRAWAPQHFLVYFALRRYKHLPEVFSALLDLVKLGQETMLSEWLTFGHVAENYNALTGFTQDSGNSDPFYSWGGCFGMPSVLEGGYM